MKKFLVRIKRSLCFILNYLREKYIYKVPKMTIANDVYSEGIHVFKNEISEDKLNDLLNDFDMRVSQKNDADIGQSTGRVYSEGLLSPVMEGLMSNLNPYLDDYFGTACWKIEISYYQESFPQLEVDNVPGGEFHVDDNKANLKYFVYLDDVLSKNGPFSCVPNTNGWKVKASFLRGLHWAFFEARKSLYSYLLDERFCLQNEIEVVGSKGTNFLVDTTALHRAKPVVEGSRKVAVISFNRR